ncbi:hypothetical protein NKH86_13105 [Mesorhizobium sp. M0913]|uniref:hypothetical protein n=1 Tax=Mesorhizobium sp. M0913 TaxID=2957026 RepID=UPI003338AB0F
MGKLNHIFLTVRSPRPRAELKQKLSARDAVAIYLSLLLSLANFMVVFHGFLFGPSVIVVNTPSLTLYHQGCYKGLRFSEMVIQVNFANNSLSGKNGILTLISAELKSNERSAIFMASNEVSISGTQNSTKYDEITNVLETDLSYNESQKVVFCREDGNYFRNAAITTIDGNVEAVSVEESNVKSMNIRFSPVDEDMSHNLSIGEAKKMLKDKNINGYSLLLSYKLINDGIVDNLFRNNERKLICKLQSHNDLYAVYISQGWVDINLLSCE